MARILEYNNLSNLLTNECTGILATWAVWQWCVLIHCKLRVDQSIRSCIQPRNSQGIINDPRYVFARMNTCTHHVMEKFVYFGNCGSKSRRTPPQDIINPCQETRRKFPLTIIPSFFRKTAKHSGIRLSSKKW